MKPNVNNVSMCISHNLYFISHKQHICQPPTTFDPKDSGSLSSILRIGLYPHCLRIDSQKQWGATKNPPKFGGFLNFCFYRLLFKLANPLLQKFSGNVLATQTEGQTESEGERDDYPEEDRVKSRGSNLELNERK